MKIEKVETEQSNFKPVKITLILENENDLKQIYFRYICQSDISPIHSAYNHNEQNFQFNDTPDDLSNLLVDLYNNLNKKSQ